MNNLYRIETPGETFYDWGPNEASCRPADSPAEITELTKVEIEELYNIVHTNSLTLWYDPTGPNFEGEGYYLCFVQNATLDLILAVTDYYGPFANASAAAAWRFTKEAAAHFDYLLASAEQNKRY